MPTGLPNPSNIAESARSAIGFASAHIRDAAEYLRIPSYAEYSVGARDAYTDLIRSFKSGWNLFHLTFRPLFILLALLGRYVAIALKILAECTVKHGIIAAREGAGQAQVGAKWFVAWQRSLSRGAILAELGGIAAVVGMYLLRRHIRRKRYVEKVRRWSARKKARTLRSYNNFVVKVSKTSTLLAMILPHALYVVVVSVSKYLTPWMLRYFATKTYLMMLISLWIPFVRTVMIIHRWGNVVQREKSKRAPVSEEINGSKSGKNSATRNDCGSERHVRSAGKKSSNVAKRYLKATEQPTAPSDHSPARQRDANSSTLDELVEDSLVQLCDEAVALLKYWIVFALVLSFFRALSMLPVVGRILAVEDASKITANGARGFRRWQGQAETKTFLSSLKLSYNFVEEVKLVFFVWLRHLPTSLTASHESNAVQKKAAAWEMKSTGGAKRDESSNSPLEILYQKLSPIAVAAADSSSNLSQATDSDTGIKGILHRGMNLLRSFLQMAVFMKIISDTTKTWIETTLVECSALLPAAITILMPAYFTQFGCIYVSNVVPSANSAAALRATRVKCTSSDLSFVADDLSSVMRFLKYWVLHSLVSVLLLSFAPILNWVPLSTHATWLLWAYTQLESPTNRIYAVFEWELKSLGILHRHSGDSDDGTELENTMTFRMAASMIRKVSSALPSASSLDEAAEKENGGEERVDERNKSEHTVEDTTIVEPKTDAITISQGSASATKQNPSASTSTGFIAREVDSVGLTESGYVEGVDERKKSEHTTAEGTKPQLSASATKPNPNAQTASTADSINREVDSPVGLRHRVVPESSRQAGGEAADSQTNSTSGARTGGVSDDDKSKVE